MPRASRSASPRRRGWRSSRGPTRAPSWPGASRRRRGTPAPRLDPHRRRGRGRGRGGGLHASYASDRATAECDPAGGACAADFSGRQAAKASAETARTGAYASFGVASAALVGGVIAFLTSEDEDPDADFTPRVDRGARASLLGASAPGGFARAALGGSSLP